MRTRELLTTGAVMLALLGSFGIAGAQQPQADPEQDAQADKARTSPSGQAGKEEPSSYAPTSKPQDTAVFINGALAVPGAPTDTETAPAKFSKKNADDDKLITYAYTFKNLTDEQRRKIFAALKDNSSKTAFNADIGAELPPTIELRPMPGDIAMQVPQTKAYRFVVADKRVLLVEPANRVVVATLADDPTLTEGSGQR